MPNPNARVNVKYTPGNSNPWSQAPDVKVKVTSGQTEIDWSIQVIPGSAGTIAFNTAAATPGIQFTGTGNNAWPGSIPSGSANAFSATINNTLQPGQNAVPYHYQVNAIYTPAGGSATNVTWDPDVEEDPPHVIVG